MAKFSNRNYRKGNNWSANGGTYRNGNGRRISKPRAYFKAVADNKYGYNSGYRNGNGSRIRKPKAYYRAVANDKYGFNR